MGDKKGGEVDKTFAELDREAIEKYNKSLQVSLEREARLLRHYEWRGNRIAPFNIEPMPWERERLAGAGMTAEDRALRKQWLKDQELAPHEPVYIAELYPKNPIRRALAAPWDGFFGAVKPFVGERVAGSGRFWIPKMAIGAATLYAIYYHMKYNPNQWVDKHGWNIYSSKPTLQMDGVEASQKTDFYDRGFKQRAVLLNSK